MKRWFFAALCAVIGAGLMLIGMAARAQNYPTKPVRIVAATAGTTGDLFARRLAQQLSERWGVQVIVDNRSGAGATIAADVAAKAPPDGYTLHIGQVASFAAATSLYRKLPYDPVRDFAPITRFADVPVIVIAHPSLPAASLREFIEYAKKRPGAISYSSAGNGTGSHLTMEFLSHTVGIKLLHIPYKGSGAATTAVVSGEVPVSGIVVPNALPQVKAGKVRAYAITSKQRFSGAPDIPTAEEAGLRGFESTAWFAMFAPARTPKELVERLNRDMVEILRAPASDAWLLSQGAIPSPGTPDELAAFLRSETAKWKKVIELSGAKVD